MAGLQRNWIQTQACVTPETAYPTKLSGLKSSLRPCNPLLPNTHVLMRGTGPGVGNAPGVLGAHTFSPGAEEEPLTAADQNAPPSLFPPNLVCPPVLPAIGLAPPQCKQDHCSQVTAHPRWQLQAPKGLHSHLA